MAKEKKEKPVINLDGVEYIIEDLTDEQKMMVNHIFLAVKIMKISKNG